MNGPGTLRGRLSHGQTEPLPIVGYSHVVMNSKCYS